MGVNKSNLIQYNVKQYAGPISEIPATLPFGDYYFAEDIEVLYKYNYQGVPISIGGGESYDRAEFYSQLPDGKSVGNLAYANSSEGTYWLPGTVGGSYYPAGWYLWTGALWKSDRNSIANQLQTNINSLNTKVDKISGYSLTKNNLTDALKALYDSAVSWISTNGATLISHLSNINNPHSVTKSQVGLSNVPNTNFTSAVSLNTNKVGITTSQSSNILTNNQKISYTSALENLKVDKVAGKSLILDTEAVRLTKFSGGITEIDFGALPVYQKEFTITDASVLATSNITASLAYEAPTDKDLDELEMDYLTIICGQATNGTFKMLVKSIDNSYLADKFKINYSITI